MVFDFRSSNPCCEIFNMFDTNLLVRGQGGLCEEIVQSPVAFVDPDTGLTVADAIYPEEELECDVRAVAVRVVKAAETAGFDNFLDLECKTRTDAGNSESFFFGSYLVCLLLECSYSFSIGDCSPMFVRTFVIVCHFVQDFNGFGIGIAMVFCACMFIHAAKSCLPRLADGRIRSGLVWYLLIIFVVRIFRCHTRTNRTEVLIIKRLPLLALPPYIQDLKRSSLDP